MFKLSRLLGDHEGPFVSFESFFHPSVGLTGKEDFSRPLYDILEYGYNVIPGISRENIRAVKAGKETANLLRMRKGDPVLSRERLVSDSEGKPIEYNLGYYRTDKFIYSIEISSNSVNTHKNNK